jgi:deoxyadenosine/deoxycytidine kinase
MVKLIVLNANLSVGKSTILSRLANDEIGNKSFIMCQEPIKSWLETLDADGTNILERFYTNKKRYSFLFQINALFTRCELLDESFIKARKYEEETGNEAIIVSERDISSDLHIFASMLHENKELSLLEFNIYLKMFNKYVDNYKVTKNIYIRAYPEICHKRLIGRNRTGEETIPLEYLQLVHDKHELLYKEVLSLNNCLLIDNNGELNDESYNNIYKQIRDHIFN